MQSLRYITSTCLKRCLSYSAYSTLHDNNNKYIVNASATVVRRKHQSTVSFPLVRLRDISFSLSGIYNTNIYNTSSNSSTPNILIDYASKRFYTNCQKRYLHKSATVRHSTLNSTALASQMAANIILGANRGNNNNNRNRAAGGFQTHQTQYHSDGDMSRSGGNLSSSLINNTMVTSNDTVVVGTSWDPLVLSQVPSGDRMVPNSNTNSLSLSTGGGEVFVMAPSYTEVEGERDAQLTLQRMKSERKNQKKMNISKNMIKDADKNSSRFTGAHRRFDYSARMNNNNELYNSGYSNNVEDDIDIAVSYKENAGTLQGRKSDEYVSLVARDGSNNKLVTDMESSERNATLSSVHNGSSSYSHNAIMVNSGAMLSADDVFALLDDDEVNNSVSGDISDTEIIQESPHVTSMPTISTPQTSSPLAIVRSSYKDDNNSLQNSADIFYSTTLPSLPTPDDHCDYDEDTLLSPLPVPIYSCKVCKKALFAFVKGLLSETSFGLNSHLTGYPCFRLPIKESAVVLRKCHASNIITEENGDESNLDKKDIKNCYKLETFVPSQPQLLKELKREYRLLVKGTKKGSHIKKEYKRKIKKNKKDRRIADRSAGDKQYSGHCGGCGVFVCVVVFHGKGSRNPLYRVNPNSVICTLVEVDKLLK